MSKALDLAAKEQEKILAIVRQMMFVYGDAEEPLSECENFVLDLVKNQLLVVLEKAHKICVEANLDEISMSGVLLQFRRQRLFINRLFKYAQAAHNVMQISTDTVVDDEAPETADIGNGKKAAGVLNELVSASTFLGIDINIEELEMTEDYIAELRSRRMADRVKLLNVSQYERFTNARKAGFTNGATKKGGRKARDPFAVWLGSPPTGKYVDFVLGFVAREVVAQIVDDALSIREQEPPNWFRDQGNAGCLQMRHYEQALQRNVGFIRVGDFLSTLC